MVYEFKFPDVGEGIHEGEIVKWFVKEGDRIKADEPLGEIETDKAIVEIPSPKTGTILKLHVKEGGIIKVGETMVTILEEGESLEEAKKQLEARMQMQAKEAKGAKEEKYTGSVVGFLEEAKEVKPIAAKKEVGKVGITSKEPSVLAIPAVRNLAKQLNVDLTKIKGTGAGGIITIDDVQKAAKGELHAIKVERKYDLFGYVDRVPLRGIRKTMSERMTESLFTAAQLTNMNEADVTELAALREKEKAKYEKEGIKLTFMPYIIKAAGSCLKQHPYLNASLEGDEIILKKYYNIGFAVDSGEGLMVPVLKGAEQKDIKTIAQEIEKLAEQARTRKINLMDLKGSTFSISNLGSIGVEFFTPIINYPESAILGVGRIIDKPIVRDGKIVVRKIMPLSLTYDHRIVDGAEAARFMNELVTRLEGCEFG